MVVVVVVVVVVGGVVFVVAAAHSKLRQNFGVWSAETSAKPAANFEQTPAKLRRKTPKFRRSFFETSAFAGAQIYLNRQIFV